MNNQNSPHSQVSAFDGTNIIDLNDEHDEFENSREIIGQWKWSEDKLLISAWLNVSIDPLVGTDQKADAFWDRIRQYCEESNPGLIKRGVQAIKKRWQRINEGAQRYGSCYDQAERKIGSGSNVDNIIELAHELHKARYKKKSNFDKHWSELRKQPKWRTPSSSGSAKRTKLSDSGAYSSSANNETPTNDNDVAMSPVRPQGTKTTKRKSKGKAKAEMIEELEEIKAVENRRLSLLEKFNANHEKEMDLKIIMADTSVMNEAQLKSTAVECLKKFVNDVILVFESEYLRKPNSNDVQRLLAMGEARGFPGMMGSIDCMHWQWKNCPKAWKGMFLSGHKGIPTIILEAVASSDLWIWHAFFGVAGSNNDINVLDRSPLFDEVLEGRAPEINYNVNGNNYSMGYYLTDGIYPEWATFVKTIPRPQGEKRKLFSKYQESQRKDVEPAFGVLQSRFAIVRGPARFWDKNDLAKIMRACIILHNMIVEDERDTYATPFGPLPIYDDTTNGLSQPNLGEEPFAPYERYIERNIQIRDRQKYRQLQTDLVEHIWQFHDTTQMM
ncbi:uncharacterized protein LOC141674890 [Apium graveolens]|uniref:uncharacterized protein LOC141674890 n=1 Tax=Apium graveolens TaxID=4045 RepID=UPI003D7A4B47